MIDFKEVKSRVTMQEIAEVYGFKPNRQNNICCPFHVEKTPSLHLYTDNWHCFGCHAGGDCITFVQKLYDLSTVQAVKKINSDLGLGLQLDEVKQEVKPARRKLQTSELNRLFEKWVNDTYKSLNRIYWKLKKWQEVYMPDSPDNVSEQFQAVLTDLTTVEGFRDLIIQGAEGQEYLYTAFHADVEHLIKKYKDKK